MLVPLRAGSDIVKNIADAGPRLLDMHIKDLMDPKGKDSQCPVGDGKPGPLAKKLAASYADYAAIGGSDKA